MMEASNFVLVNTSIACLAIFLLGSLHNLLESAFIVAKFIYKFFKNNCKKAKKDSNFEKESSP